MLKPYKEEKPIITINKIRSILNEIGIFVNERFIQNNDYFTCRLEIANKNLLKYEIGTNGKGTTIEYAFASAYAEFMERLQNDILIKKKFFFSKYYNVHSNFTKQLIAENKKLDFIYCQYEKIIETEKVVDDNFQILSNLLYIKDKKELKRFIIHTLGYENLICIPFYSKKDNKINFLPIDILIFSTGSTGMCAGNTPEEALIQGISEILERYSIQQIIINKITPPTIPHEYFKNFKIYDSIKNLEEKGLKLIIKDFSLGKEKELPVIGIIVIDEINRKYNVKVGADTWPIIALERCLTELHQSFNGIRLINKCDYGNCIKENYKNISKEQAEYINIMNVLNNSTGQWPDEIFNDNFSYEFTGLNFNLGKNNKSDLKYLSQTIDKLGFQMYIRDVSFLGFKSFYVIIPELSQDKQKKTDFTIFHNFYKIINKINNAPNLPKNELKSLVSILDNNYYFIKNNYISFHEELFFNTDKDATDLTIDLFLSMSYYKLLNIDKAYYYLDKYLSNKDVKEYLYFFACKDYFSLLIHRKNKNEVYSYMSKIYGVELSKEIIEDLKYPENIFKSYNFKSFFDCKDCDINKFDYYNIATILKNIENKHKKNTINQMNLSKIFY